MRYRRHTISLVLVFLITLAAAGSWFIAGNRPKLGLDLTGGLSVILKAKGKVKPGVIDKTITIIRDRVDRLGTTEPDITRSGSDNIIVQLPNIKDPDRALQIIGKTAVLRFREVLNVASPQDAEKADIKVSEEDDPTQPVVFRGIGRKNSKGKEDPKTALYYQLGPAEIQGDDVANALKELDTDKNQWGISLQFTGKGAEKFAAVTQRLAPQPGQEGNKSLAIVLDKRVESAPTVQSAITDGIGVISGDFSQDESEDLALVLRTGALPIELEPQQIQRISATLGKSSLKSGLIAGALGLALVVVFMLLFYRLLGLVTMLGLGVFGTMIMGLIGLIGATKGFSITLAGIAGLIVSVGIAADSYIIFYERIKDEALEGKTYRSAVEKGFKSAFRTNVSANLVAFGAAFILYMLATGPVRGFALTLGISVVFDILLLRFYTYPMVSLLARRAKPPKIKTTEKQAVTAC